MINLYNTKSRSIEILKPLHDKQVTIYSCGPTVYDYPHIGNWYAFLRWDLLVRVIKASGYQPKWVMNITDVGHLVSDADEGEDKLEKGAKREGKTAWEIAKFYTDYFLKGLDRLNFVQVDYLPKATENIPEQIDLIKKLENLNLTYMIDDGIYFDTSKFLKYSDFARLNLDSLKAGTRVEYNRQKRNPSDFALWKFSPKNYVRDMEWDSPWGKGFPGWAIECSAMAMKFLGETIDIHTGGIDHISVHHTNEIAQSESATGHNFANIWLHSNFIQVDSQKMSKSLGNLITLEDIESKGYSSETFRLLTFESHYRSEAQFTWDTLAAANNRMKALKAMSDLRWQPSSSKPIEASSFDKTYQDILRSLQNDLNSPIALSLLSTFAALLIDSTLSKSNVKEFNDFLNKIDTLFGFKLLDTKDISSEQKKLMQDREAARSAKNWVQSDKIRDELKIAGIEIRDTDYGSIWQRI